MACSWIISQVIRRDLVVCHRTKTDHGYRMCKLFNVISMENPLSSVSNDLCQHYKMQDSQNCYKIVYILCLFWQGDSDIMLQTKEVVSELGKHSIVH